MISPLSALVDDYVFDQLLPPYVRNRSPRYWTPVAVAARVGALFRVHGARKVLDVGCGPGKFCIVAGSLCSELQFHGVEQRPRLIRHGNRLARYFGVTNIRFDAKDATLVPWDDYDGFYFFNPFAENMFQAQDRFDDDASLSAARFGSELLRVESLLARARVGTVVVTYHGLGGPIPSSYELVANEPAGTNRIRVWIQGPARESSWAWLEEGDGALRVLRNDVGRTLASLAAKGRD
jgi:SAM-dependent methyltransferase